MTGLSRGQFFETRLTEELLCSPNATREVIDGVVLDARRAYHRVDDAVSRLMDTSAFETDQVFERVEFVDFYRYCDVELEEVLRFLDEQAPWIRPDDTGRSTNCLINDVGIFVHRRERGYHNYALPYSWDVRLGHKDRDAAIAELDDRIDEARVREILDEIGYGEVVPAEADPDRLVAYYTADRAVPVDELRRAAQASLPSYMVPSDFVRLDRIPLTANGKVDREALPSPQAARPDVAVPFEAPTGDVEAQLAAVWCRVLRLDRVGRNDNFFDLGGDSISAIQIAARASAAGLKLDPNLVFRRQTVAELATAVSAASPGDAEQSPDGPVPLTPVQRWFFERDPHDLSRWNQYWLLETEAGTDPDELAAALEQLPNQHDALRLRYHRDDGEWRQRYEAGSVPVPLSRVSVAGLAAVDRQERIREASEALHASFDLEQGPLIGAVLFDAGPGAASQVLVAVHHLVVDGVSWTFLLEDLEAILRGKRDALPIRLPPKTASYGQWSRSLQATAGAADLTERWSDWLAALEGARPLVVDRPGEGPPLSADSRRMRLVLTPQQTQAVLEAARRLASGRVDDLLLAGLACALRARADGAPILVDVEAHGRDAPAGDVDVSRTVGWFTAIYPESLPTDLEPGEVLGHLARRRAEAPGPPQELALALAREAGHAEWRPGSPGPRANVLVNYLGRLDLSSEPGACLRPVGALGLARGPATRRSHVLEVGAYVAGDKLTVLWDYCERSLAPETIRGASARLAEVLIELSEAEAQPRTAAFPRVDLDESELSKVAELLEKADRRHG